MKRLLRYLNNMFKLGVIKKPIISEKAAWFGQNKVPQYTFLVDKHAGKGDIKAFLKKVLGVDAVAVNTSVISGGRRRSTKARRQPKVYSYKKAMVTLKTGQKLELFKS